MKNTLIIFTALLLVPLDMPYAIGQAAVVSGKAALNICSYGAIGDGKTINTKVIQQAIDACHAAGGGRVIVPGGVFLTGAVQLKSRVTLVVEADATLLASPDIRDYGVVTVPIDWGWTYKKTAIAFAPCLIYAEVAEEVGIEGKGTVDGQGGRARKVFPNRGDTDQRRPILVRFHECRNVTLRDVTLVDPAAFTTFFVHCRDITIEDVTLRSRQTINGDGLDFDGCRNVRVARCDFDCGDDAISPKTSHPDWPNENFTITDCRMKSEWAAIRLGAESAAPMRRFEVHDCAFQDCRDGIKIESSEAALFEDLSFSRIEMREVNRPIYVTATRFNFSSHARTSRPPVGRIRDLRLSHINAVARAGASPQPERSRPAVAIAFDRACAAIVSLPGYAIENVVLSNVNLTFPGGGTAEHAARLNVAELLHFNDYQQWAQPFDGELPSSVLYLRHLRNVRLDNVRLTVEKPDARPLIVGNDLVGLTLQGVIGNAPAPLPGLAKLADTQYLAVRDCRVEGSASTPVLVEPTADELRRLAELRRHATALDQAIQQVADAFDAVGKAAPVLLLPVEWNFRPDLDNQGERARWFTAEPSGVWGKLRVDRPWGKQGHENLHGAGWYAVTFEAPPLAHGQRAFLQFGAVIGTCRVWLNGQLAGERSLDPAYVRKFPLAFDVTDQLRASTKHRVVVQVMATSADAGLTQPVELRIIK